MTGRVTTPFDLCPAHAGFVSESQWADAHIALTTAAAK
jgi:hypothetical protein